MNPTTEAVMTPISVLLQQLFDPTKSDAVLNKSLCLFFFQQKKYNCLEKLDQIV